MQNQSPWLLVADFRYKRTPRLCLDRRPSPFYTAREFYYSLFCLTAFGGLYREYPQPDWSTKWRLAPFVSF